MSSVMGETRPSRESAKAETREALVTAALAEFGERGLDAPSLDAICARAGFTRGAFYVHFRDRDDLVVAAMERVLGSFLDGVIGRGDGGSAELDQAVSRFAGVLQMLGAGHRGARVAGLPDPPPEAVPLHRMIEACVRSPAIRDRFVALLREAVARLARGARAGQAAGRVRPGLDPEAVGTVLVTLAIGVLAALEAGLPVDLEAARRTVVSLLSTA